MHVKIVFIYTINIQVSKYRFNKNSFNLILNVANGSFFNSLSKLFHNPTAIASKLQVNCKFRHIKTLFSDHQNSVKTFPKSRKWHFRDYKFKNLFGPLAFVLRPQSKRDSYGTACFCNTSVRKICVFLFVNCVFIFRIAKTFVAS